MSQQPELSRRIQVRTLGAARPGTVALDTVLEAGAAECVALARRLDVPVVHSVQCRFRLSGADASGRVVADGLLQASLDQVCVATLDEFTTTVTEQFTVRFLPANQMPDQRPSGDGTREDGEAALDPDEDDDLPYVNGTIDLGEAAAEQLALALDPYPRKPGAALPPEIGSVDHPDEEAEAATQERPSPFAVLAAQRRNST